MKSSKAIRIRSHCILAVLVLVGLGCVQSTWAQGPLYCFDERRVQHHYQIAKQQIAAGDYLSAHMNLYLYSNLAFAMGIFTQNPDFKEEIDRAYSTLGKYLQGEIDRAKNLRVELQQCEQRLSSKAGIGTRVSGLTSLPDIRLRDNPPSLR